MTESTQPAPDPSNTVPDVPDAQTGPAEQIAPAKKATSKRAAKKAAASAPTPAGADSDRATRSLYLPALPEGFAYTAVAVTGPNGETINIAPGDADDARLSFDGAGLRHDQHYADMQSALRGSAKAAKAMVDVAKREAELKRIREEAFDL